MKKIVITKNKWIGFIGLCILCSAGMPFVSNYVLRPLYGFFNKVWATTSFVPHFVMLDFVLLGFAVYMYFFYKFKNFEDKRNNILGWGFLLLLALRTLVAYDSTLGRSAQYFFVMCYALVPNVVESQNRENRMLVKIVMTVFLFFYFMRGIISSAVFPYRPFWR